MAGRRCFSEKIVESDDFYELSASAQALYYHLNQAADDDGFVNNASNIATRIKGGKTALSDLVKRRFLLQFGNIYVVKHWRISNSLKNDRLKSPQYPNIASQIWVKPNRAYTDHPVAGCKTLHELKTGIHLESTWNPFGILTEPNRTEPKRTEPNRTGMEGCFAELWDDYPELRRGSLQEAKAAFAEKIQTADEGALALDSLQKWKESQQWAKEGGRYIPLLSNWLLRDAWQSAPTAENGAQGGPRQLDADEIAAIHRMMGEDFEEDNNA